MVAKFSNLADEIIESIANTPKSKLPEQGIDEVVEEIKLLILKANKRLKKILKGVALRYNKIYKRPSALFSKLSKFKVTKEYGALAWILVKRVEREVKNLKFILKSGNAKGKMVLASGIVDTKTGKISKIFSNFTDKEVRDLKHVDFVNEMHPNLKERFFEHFRRRGNDGSRLKLENPDDLKFGWKTAGDVPVLHTEVRALDYLLKQIDPKKTTRFSF